MKTGLAKIRNWQWKGKSLDQVVIDNSAFKSFDELLEAKGNYRPSIDVAVPEKGFLAEAYNTAQELRGDERRAFCYNIPKGQETWLMWTR